jgi:hypothetical protein
MLCRESAFARRPSLVLSASSKIRYRITESRAWLEAHDLRAWIEFRDRNQFSSWRQV